MLGLSWELVEHWLPIKFGFMPYKQPAQRFNPIIYDRLKEEVERLLDVGFIQLCWYVEWVFNIVPVEKKNTGKIWVFIDFHNLNKATPKDEYPMPIADMLINNAFGHWVIIFLDGNTSYKQFFMAEEDMSKTVFCCPSFIGLFEWLVMTFGLKNICATYQRAMNLIFHDLLGIILEICIDYVIIKSDTMDSHLDDLRLDLERMHQYGLKMNPLKCVFGVLASKFLGFIIHEHGIEIDPTKIEFINKVQPPQYKNDMQKLLEKLNYLMRFIITFVGEDYCIFSYTPVKEWSRVHLGVDQQRAFDDIKKYLSSPSVMKEPMAEIPFWLYIVAKDAVIRADLMQVMEGKEHIITYLRQCLIDTKIRYSFIEKLCLSLFYACSELRYYLLSSTCIVACQADVIRHMLYQPILSGRIGKWAYALIEYDLAYESLKFLKGQVVADFIVGHSIDQNIDESCNLVSIHPWKLFFDGSMCREGQGVAVVLEVPFLSNRLV
jgi:hypothetical protein